MRTKIRHSGIEVRSPFYPLIGIVCGFEKSGTTLLNEILRRHPGLDSGFEGGFLLGASPREFKNYQPYYAFFRQTWELSRSDMLYICDTDAWAECYRRARERAPFITNKKTYIFDKTPIYMRYLASVLEKVPGIPCVVTVRDPRALMLSWANWSGFKHDPECWLKDNLELNRKRFSDYAEGYHKAVKKHGDRIMLIQFEKLCVRPEPTLMKVFQFLGFKFQPEFMSFSSKHFVNGNSISTDYLFPYRDKLSKSLCKRILDGTKKYADWHYFG